PGQRAHPAPADRRERTCRLPRRAPGPDRGAGPAGAGDRAVPARRRPCWPEGDPMNQDAGPAPGGSGPGPPRAGQGTTGTGQRRARTSRTARDPISRWPALADAPTTTASARISSAIRRISAYASPSVAMKVIEMPSSADASAARRRRSAARSLAASRSAATRTDPPGVAAPSDASGATYTAVTLAPCLRARPAAYEAARSEVVESSTPTRISLGPSVPSSNSPGAACSTSGSVRTLALRPAVCLQSPEG